MIIQDMLLISYLHPNISYLIQLDRPNVVIVNFVIVYNVICRPITENVSQLEYRFIEIELKVALLLLPNSVVIFTMHASEGDCEVSLQVTRTRSLGVQGDDGNDTVTTAGTQTVEVRLHVHATTNVSVVFGDAASQSHATVLGTVDENDLVVATCRIESLPFAVLDRICRMKQTLG